MVRLRGPLKAGPPSSPLSLLAKDFCAEAEVLMMWGASPARCGVLLALPSRVLVERLALKLAFGARVPPAPRADEQRDHSAGKRGRCASKVLSWQWFSWLLQTTGFQACDEAPEGHCHRRPPVGLFSASSGIFRGPSR